LISVLRILIVSQYYWPEEFLINDIAPALAARGNEITVLTGKPNYPEGKIFGVYTFDETVEAAMRLPEAARSRELTDGTTLWASYAPKLSEFNSQIWQDPYLTGKQRKRTKTALEGVGLGADYLLGSALSLAYRYGELSIDNDDAGKSLSSRLTPTEIKQLQRGEERHHALLSLTFPLTDNFFLIPGASYTLTNAEGSANNYSSEELNLTVAYQKDSFEAFVEGYLVDAKYDEPNPVFRKKREDERYGITTGISYLNPFGWNNIKLDLLIGYSRENSNIHFFDSREEFIAAGLTYEY